LGSFRIVPPRQQSDPAARRAGRATRLNRTSRGILRESRR
jgi:hypothetical protein